jgi:hypothetical protein
MMEELPLDAGCVCTRVIREPSKTRAGPLVLVQCTRFAGVTDRCYK